MTEPQKVTPRIRAVIERGQQDRFWKPTDFDGIAGPMQIDRVLWKLAKSGELRSVRRGLYWRGRKTRFGMSHPTTNALVQALVGTKGVGPAGLTAANDLGLTTQLPAVESFAVPNKPPRPVSSIRFVNRSGRPHRVSAGLNATEVALLEVLGDWDRVVEVPTAEANRVVMRLFADGDVRGDRLMKAASSEPTGTRMRLRALLAETGARELAARIPPARSDLKRTELAGMG